MARSREKKTGHGGKRDGAGRSEFVATEVEQELVRKLKGCGMTDERIARAIRPEGVSLPTLKKHFKSELENGKDSFDAHVMGKVADLIEAGDVAMIIFYCKARLGWSEKFVVEQNVTAKTDTEAWNELERRLNRIAAVAEAEAEAEDVEPVIN